MNTNLSALAACARATVLAIALALALALGLAYGATVAGAADARKPEAKKPEAKQAEQNVDPHTWVDHDGRPIPEPAKREKSPYGHAVRESFFEPISHALDIPDKILWLASVFGADNEHEAANVNEFDELPNSTWFTNRNHVRALTAKEIRIGPGGKELHPKPPLTIVGLKKSGVNVGFTVKDADGKRWAVKLDRPGYPQLSSGADAVVTRLFWAAGYNLPYDVPLTFTRDELAIDDEVKGGKEGDKPFGEVELDTLLTYGHKNGNGRWYGMASLFLEGKPIGPIDSRKKRKDDPNDIYTHKNRRELRGLEVLSSWVGSWDTKDHQTFESFVETEDSLGYVRHHILDVGASLGAAGEGPKSPSSGYEHYVDFGWSMKRLLTLGFVVEPWRRAPQQTGIPSVGNFESVVWKPNGFRPYQPHPAFRERTDRDGYWGAKLVASFSDEQIDAAIDAAGYEDPRAKPLLAKLLRERRDKVAQYWFGQVAPLDFFHLDGEEIRFHDLAVDRGLEQPRLYRIDVRADGGKTEVDSRTCSCTAIPLAEFGPANSTLELAFHVDGSDAAPARVNLVQREGRWSIVRVTHG